MDNANYSPPMLKAVVASGALDRDPFMLVDVGCGLGLDPAWRLFGKALHGHGFDPQVEECRRLARQEKNPNVHYHAVFVGLPDGDPFLRRRRERAADETYYEPFSRTSTQAALTRAATIGGMAFQETNDWGGRELTPEKVGLADFLCDQGVGNVDFVKVDTDGGDLEVLLSFEEAIEASGVLGFMVETPFTGSDSDTANTFHNVDRLLKRHGFLLCTLTVNRYSRAALPAPFAYSMLAQTTWGPAMWGDLVYLRDGVHPEHVRFGELSAAKLLKLACLYELFQAPDCAAEILVTRRDRLSPLVDVDGMLDLLTPPLDGKPVRYREYVAAFEQDPARFYPPSPGLLGRQSPGLPGRVLNAIARRLRSA